VPGPVFKTGGGSGNRLLVGSIPMRSRQVRFIERKCREQRPEMIHRSALPLTRGCVKLCNYALRSGRLYTESSSNPDEPVTEMSVAKFGS
jgi:hypothetical protein